MKFGLFGGARARGGPAGDSEGYHDFINYVVEAERLGFSSVFLVEHHFTGFGQVSASLILLSYLAARTERIRLGTAVVVLPWHNPVLVAEAAATLGLLSNRRLAFGVGVRDAARLPLRGGVESLHQVPPRPAPDPPPPPAVLARRRQRGLDPPRRAR